MTIDAGVHLEISHEDCTKPTKHCTEKFLHSLRRKFVISKGHLKQLLHPEEEDYSRAIEAALAAAKAATTALSIIH